MERIHVTLADVLEQLNPKLILQRMHGKRHRVETWRRRYLSQKDLRRDAKVETDIYNEGRLEVTVYALPDEAATGSVDFFCQTPLTKFRQNVFGEP